MMDTSTDNKCLVHTNLRVLNAAEKSLSWSFSSYLCVCMSLSALLTLLNTFKKACYWYCWGNVRLCKLVLIFTASTWGDCSFFLSLHFYFLLFVFVCLYVHLSVCLSVYVSVGLCVFVYMSLSLSVCVCVCLYVCMYYVYMYVAFIVINVSKLLRVRRPTSSPRAVWNPCKIN